MSDITEGDLLAFIEADYAASMRRPGDVTVSDLLATMRKINPHATQGQAEYKFRQWAACGDIEVVEIIDQGKHCNALRKRPQAG